MLKTKLALLIGCLSFGVNAASFEAVTLGSKGGIQDGNLTAFMLKSEQDDNYVMLDAGSLVNGLIISEQKGAFDGVKVPAESKYTKVGYLLTERVKGYLISHAHLDHVLGMIISSPDDSNKPIYGLSATNEALMSHYFNWSAWPNFGNEGNGFKLSKYTYTDLPEYQWQDVKDTSMQVMAMPLAHSGGQSTAFMLKDKDGDVFVYFGDTGPDAVEKSDALSKVWSTLAPFVQQDKLKGIVIEVSFTNQTSDKALFGHLTPNWLLKELTVLETLAGKGSLNQLDVVISHIKFSLKKGEDPQVVINRQLDEVNNLGVKFHFPAQGDVLSF
ncbi:MBL fold metallo-hydrolase [Vibrio vulnificus]|uniref:MBL fold metallo-hydrolase n=1 Tax=Vibrio vulnificus TaxID=672 RepID=UPI000505F632|nr:3',5'-cyclic-nucleotide phosphodiesterase [Vibrio vulnificus]EHY1015333.1 3',5'-cyclic-nucleotide phosphodiesterase [Vibrio vulnificus]EHY1123443.1 3',5'-cyclic-nucleotide phosphodiesterase [Vibrio vulnificus]KFK48631.1 3',5'-cyclic-nucleotide phosphodiesterase [Vibrio vulnificus]KFK53095.1 3',5'-cyclic-nucleotide phosphodiesterase [Vibrio vulnificus]PNG70693.1 3',5'-cyclic-nucleotide phosphodiesterase [Vibrio vulnificus]